MDFDDFLDMASKIIVIVIGASIATCGVCFAVHCVRTLLL